MTGLVNRLCQVCLGLHARAISACWCTVLLAQMTASPAWALDPHRTLTQYVHSSWQSEQGLPENAVLALLQTSDGYLWVGTQDDLGLDSHFFRIYGGNSFEQKKPDPVGIEALLGERPTPRDRTVMVGDSSVDILTARNARVVACGVTWRFQPATFVLSPPDLRIDHLNQLATRVLS